ncbi:hypothetical protein GQ602_006986 [Ophiocordyceps camponoti-floridani]|uniref:Uncharacterized protein n=1 Tax=Ophiocordyceps camponoti-floridani TaxID=2030778 RepID=A0A8H4VAK0_9HYPO|nr:hypothetical protein GQ602_006986 [Ophiocordyceps camponoti-floridani]
MTASEASETPTEVKDTTPVWKMPHQVCTGSSAAESEYCFGTEQWCKQRIYQFTSETFNSPMACMRSRKNHPAFVDELLTWKEPQRHDTACFTESTQDPVALEACVGTEEFCDEQYYQNFGELFEDAEDCKKSRQGRPDVEGKPAGVDDQDSSAGEKPSATEEASFPSGVVESATSSKSTSSDPPEHAEEEEGGTSEEEQVLPEENDKVVAEEDRTPPADEDETVDEGQTIEKDEIASDEKQSTPADEDEATLEEQKPPADETASTRNPSEEKEEEKPSVNEQGSPEDEDEDTSVDEKSVPADERKVSNEEQSPPEDQDAKASEEETPLADEEASTQEASEDEDGENPSDKQQNPSSDEDQDTSVEDESAPVDGDKGASGDEQNPPAAEEEKSSEEQNPPADDNNNNQPKPVERRWKNPRQDSPFCSGILGQAAKLDEKCVGTGLWCSQHLWRLTNESFPDDEACNNDRQSSTGYVGRWKEARDTADGCLASEGRFAEDCVGTEAWCDGMYMTTGSIREDYSSAEECKELRSNRPDEKEVAGTTEMDFKSIVNSTKDDVIPVDSSFLCWTQGREKISLFCNWMPDECDEDAGCVKLNDVPAMCDEYKGCGRCHIGKETKSFVCALPEAEEPTDADRDACRQACSLTANASLAGAMGKIGPFALEIVCNDLYC